MFRPVMTVFGLVMALAASPATAADRPPATLYKNPQCGCCEEYARYLRRNGFEVKVVATHNLSLIKRQAGGVPEKLEGCHTTFVDKYIVEGHVPAKDIQRMLAERPAIVGLAVPGMPIGSPGMEVAGMKSHPYDVLAFDKAGETRVFVSYR